MTNGSLLGTVAVGLLVVGCGDDARGLQPLEATGCPSLAGAWSEGPSDAAPATLAETGLYCDIAHLAPAPGARAYRPAFELWSDGAQKRRWIQLPPGAPIDATDVDHWSFPVGTRVWKEFSYAGRRVETRVIARTGAGADDFLYAAYRWNDDQTDATLAPQEGIPDVAPLGGGPDDPRHDIPSVGQCRRCHDALPEHVLGLGAIQAMHDGGGLTLRDLVAEGLLAPAPAAPIAVPGDALARAALGYLHANCSHCHNDTPAGVTYPGYVLRLRAADTTVEETATYRTAVDVLHTWLEAPAGVGPYRIAGGDPDGSAIYYRTGVRAPDAQMPPIGTELVDAAGHDLLRRWIASLPRPAAPEPTAALPSTAP
jgi:hypothetical protein